MDKQNQNLNQETTVLDFLNYIKNIIKKIISFTGEIFKYIFNTILSFFVLLKRNIIFIVVTVIIFGTVGYFDKEILPASYDYEMIVEPNYNSTNSLYQLINSYNEQAESNDATFFKGIKKINIYPIKTFTNDLAVFYSTVKKLSNNSENVNIIDTIFTKELIENFRKNINNTDYPYQKIYINSSVELSSKELKDKILVPIENDPYFKQCRNAKITSIDYKIEQSKKELKLIDTLLLSIAKRNISNIPTSSSLSFSAENKNNVETDLLNKSTDFIKKLADLELERVKLSQVITLISEPQKVINKTLITEGRISSYSLYGLLFAISILLFIQFVKYLNKFEKKHS